MFYLLQAPLCVCQIHCTYFSRYSFFSNIVFRKLPRNESEVDWLHTCTTDIRCQHLRQIHQKLKTSRFVSLRVKWTALEQTTLEKRRRIMTPLAFHTNTRYLTKCEELRRLCPCTVCGFLNFSSTQSAFLSFCTHVALLDKKRNDMWCAWAEFVMSYLFSLYVL